MLTVVLYALAAIAVAAVIVVVLVVVLPDDTLAVAAADRTPTGLPTNRVIGADDLEQVRLPVGLRGYRMVETDAVIDRLVSELEQRDRTIAALRAQRDETAYQAQRERTASAGWAHSYPSSGGGAGAPGPDRPHDSRDHDAAAPAVWTPPSLGDDRAEPGQHGAGRGAEARDGLEPDPAATPAEIADARRPSGAVGEHSGHPYVPPDRGTPVHAPGRGHGIDRPTVDHHSVDPADVHSADVHSADVHSADVHSTDVHSTDVDPTDVDPTDVHSADAHGSDGRPGTTPAPQ